MNDRKGKKVKGLPFYQKAAMYVFITLIGVVFFFIGLYIFIGPDFAKAKSLTDVSFFSLFGNLFLGSLSLLLGAFLYLVTITTQCFTFNFHRPIWKSLKVKFSFVYTIFLCLVGVGLGLSSSIILTPLLKIVSFPKVLSTLLPLLMGIMLVNFVFAQITVWVPLEISVLKKRMKALGLSESEITQGIYIGISDLTKSSFKKFDIIEDDIGLLWIMPDRIVYRGDNDNFEFDRNQLLEISREVDKGSAAAYSGIVHIIIRFRDKDGSERKVRFHIEGKWNVDETRRALDELAERLYEWQGSG